MSSDLRRVLRAMQQLAAIGLPDRAAFPEFVRLLSELAPFETASMLWLDAELRGVDIYRNHDPPRGTLARYAERWFNAGEAAYYPTQREMQTNRALTVLRVSDFTRELAETEIYDEVFRPQDHHWILAVALKSGARPIGNLGLGRPKRGGDFSDEEVRRLELARPYVVQALSRQATDFDWADAEAEDAQAFLIADLAGRVTRASPGAWRLLHGACGAPPQRELFAEKVEDWAKLLLSRLAAAVADSLRGVAGPPACMALRTAYGRFVIRAYALGDPGGGTLKEIGVQIEQRLPLAALMLRSHAYRALSRTEQEIAQMLGQKLSYNEIAARRQVAYSTVVTHVRNLAQKLGVAGREDIVRTLTAATSS